MLSLWQASAGKWYNFTAIGSGSCLPRLASPQRAQQQPNSGSQHFLGECHLVFHRASTDNSLGNIPQLLRSSARRFPDRPALRSWADAHYPSMTYRELLDAVEQFGAGLMTLGLKRGDRVAIVADNGPRWAISYLAGAAAGGVGVPIYYELDGKEITRLIEESGSRCVVLSGQVLDKIGRHLPHLDIIIVVDRDRAELHADAIKRRHWFHRQHPPVLLSFEEVFARATPESRHALAQVNIRSDDLASIVYTSGTTGDAKGVMLTHNNIISNALSSLQVVRVSSRDKLLLVLPLHHSFPFTAGLILPLAAGAEISFENDLRRIRDRMQDCRATVFIAVPALLGMMYRAIVSRVEAEGKMESYQQGIQVVERVKRLTGVNVGRLVFRSLHQRFGGRLRFFVSGGAALPPETTRNYALLGIPVLQGWGLTEASPVVAAQEFLPLKFYFTNHYERQIGSVGKPIPGVEVVTIDVPEKGIYAAMHGEGELAVRGPNVTRGYYNNEAASRDLKIGEWLRTGDIGRIDAQGNIYITGRAKFVIVLSSGDKVYPDEVEDRLMNCPLIADVCVVGRQVRKLFRGDKIDVVAIVYPNPEAVQARSTDQGVPVTEAAIHQWISEDISQVQASTPDFKKVSEVVLTDHPLPKTPLRKIRRGMIQEAYNFDLERFLQNGTKPDGRG